MASASAGLYLLGRAMVPSRGPATSRRPWSAPRAPSPPAAAPPPRDPRAPAGRRGRGGDADAVDDFRVPARFDACHGALATRGRSEDHLVFHHAAEGEWSP